MSTISVKELEGLLKSEPFKFISLTDADGNTVVAFNNPRISVDKRKKEILDNLKSSTLPDGIYVFRFKQSIENSNIKTYNVMKGKGVKLSEAPAPVAESPKREREVITVKEENVLGWQSALEMQNKIATLTAQNLALTKENQQLAEDLAELEEQYEEDEEGLEDGGDTNFLSDILTKAIPFAEKYFEQKDRELEILHEIGLSKASVAPGGTNPQKPVYNPAAAPKPKTTTPTPPTPAPTPAPGQTVFIPQPGSPGYIPPDTATTPKDDSEEIKAALIEMRVEDLKKLYEGMKNRGALTEIQKFVRIMKTIRPRELEDIVSDDIK